ncbi:MAG: hypothetical protein C0501_13350 [Isosphaera sp.]|nr:hypothetical protein [Isosphaera sp.]
MPRAGPSGWWAALAAALFAAGCGDGVVRREVSGTVRLEGTPVAQGLIEFEPLDGQPTRTSADIKGGEFRLPQNEGLADGRYQVRISATGRTDPIPVPPGHVGPPPVPKEWQVRKIPDRYNRNSDLAVEVGDKENVFPFELKGK